MAKTNGKTPKAKPLPAGYESLGSDLAGFFLTRPGNAIEGIYRGSFNTKSKYGERRAFRIEVSKGTTAVSIKGGDEDIAEVGQIVALDEKGYTKRISSLEEGTKLFVRCEGKGEAEKDPWVFTIGVQR